MLLRSSGSSGGGEGGGGEAELTTMTFQEFESVTTAATRESIEEEFGPSVPRETVIQAGVIPDDPANAGCIYYKADPPTFGEWFEFCFDAGRLSNKTSL